jgi:hypothetical protein
LIESCILRVITSYSRSHGGLFPSIKGPPEDSHLTAIDTPKISITVSQAYALESPTCKYKRSVLGVSACFKLIHSFTLFHQLLHNQSSTTQLPITKTTVAMSQATGWVDHKSQNVKYPGKEGKEDTEDPHIEDVPYNGITNLFKPASATRMCTQGWSVFTDSGMDFAERDILASHPWMSGVVTEETIRVWKHEQTGDEHRRSLVVKDGKRYQVHWYYVDCGPRWCGRIDKERKCYHVKIGFMDYVPPGFTPGRRWDAHGNPYRLDYAGPRVGRYDL